MLTPEQELEFCRLRREIIGLNYQALNSEQRRAVGGPRGPPRPRGVGGLGGFGF